MNRPSLPFDLLDVFARRPLEGNLLAVVHDADEVPDHVMRRLATRFRLSETSFVQAATDEAADYRHRIFTIAQELPFAGHPSVGTAAAVVRRRGQSTATVVQQTIEGLQRLDVEVRLGGDGVGDRDRAHVSLEQSPATFGAQIPTQALMAGLGLERDSARPNFSAQFVSTGLPTLIVPLADVGALGRAKPNWPALAEAVAAHADVGFLNFYLVVERGRGEWSARCFGEDMSGGEDPATGSAAGPLGAFVEATLGIDSIEIDQGVEMGEPSHISVTVRNGRPIVAGDVEFLGSGTIDLPQE
jgi:trans-2,3-dihydro-3-hydroxyanthranilate isomerase